MQRDTLCSCLSLHKAVICSVGSAVLFDLRNVIVHICYIRAAALNGKHFLIQLENVLQSNLCFFKRNVTGKVGKM